MAIDWQAPDANEIAKRLQKPRPGKLERADRMGKRRALDLSESAKVKVRSGGQCEVAFGEPQWVAGRVITFRCQRRAVHSTHVLETPWSACW